MLLGESVGCSTKRVIQTVWRPRTPTSEAGCPSAENRSGRVTITHADPRILVESEHLYLIVEGKAPSWLTLVPPSPTRKTKIRRLQ